MGMADQVEVELVIDGMHCGACVRRVTGAIEKVAGAKALSVDVGKAKVSLPSPADMGKVVDTIAKAGFAARPA